MDILFSLRSLHLSFGHKVLFKNTGLTVYKGEKIGLLGPNGRGKSSLFKILNEELFPDHSQPPCTFDKNLGNDPFQKYSTFLVPQVLPLQENDQVFLEDYFFRFFPNLKKIHEELIQISSKIEEHSSEELVLKQAQLLERYEQLEGNRIFQRFCSYLKMFGLEDLKVKVQSLSGGEQKKILLSLGLSNQADLVLWDEPTNHLDLETIKIFEEELKNADQTLMIISHDRYLLSKIPDRILQIDRGQISGFKGNYTDYLKQVAEKEEERIKCLTKIENTLRREQDWMRQGIKARGTRSKKRVENFHKIQEKVHDIKGQAKKNLLLNLHADPSKSKQLVDLSHIHFQFKDNSPLFTDLNLSIFRGEKIGLMGKNGAGKSTLIKIIMEEYLPQDGKVKKSPDLKINYFSQKREELNPNMTPHEFLSDGQEMILLPNGSQRHVAAYFEEFLFAREDLYRPISTLSGGEQNRLQMAKNLLSAGDLWIFDEPTNDLDIETLQILEEKLSEFSGGLLLICHDRTFLNNVTNTIWLLEDRQIEIFHGGYSQVEDYLDAHFLEEQLKQEVIVEEEEKPPVKEKKIFNNQKLDEEILKVEKLIESFQEQISNFNFENMSEEKTKRFKEMSDLTEKLEEKLLHLYEEQENQKG